MAGSPRRTAPLLNFSPKSRTDARLHFGPAVSTGYSPQRYERVDVLASPVHATALQPRLDHHFVGALRAAAANRVAHVIPDRPVPWQTFLPDPWRLF
jgi:uncharacterized protein YciW